MKEPLFIGSNIYRGSSYGARHPLSIPRVPTVIDLCRALGWLGSGNYRNSPRAKPAALQSFHSSDYITSLQAAEARQTVTQEDRDRHGLGTLSNPVFGEMFRRPATSAGGSMFGAELIRNGGVVYNPGGGTHHGMPDRAAGFCFLNDPVLAIQRLLTLGIDRVAYVDIDAHHCDGVEAAFEGSEQVRLISVHEDRRWPFTGGLSDRAGGAAFNLPVHKGLNDTEFQMILHEFILPLVTDFAPDAIVLQCGADAVLEDPLARLNLSNTAHWSCVQALQALTTRFLVLGGGGYNPWTVGRLWAGVWATLNGYEIPQFLPPDAQNVLGNLTWDRKAQPTIDLLTTLADKPRYGPINEGLKSDISLLVSAI